MGFEFREVDFDELVVFGIVILMEFFGVRVGEVIDFGMFGGFEVVVYVVVEGEEGGGGINFSIYVVDGIYISGR